MDASDPAAPYLPTLERARAAGLHLPLEEPAEQRRLAALVVVATILRRESWEEEMELGGEIFATLQMGDPPIPPIFVEQSFRRLVEVVETHPCRMCQVHPGCSACRICGGSGELDFFTKCSCNGGFIPCTTCLGSQISNQVRMRYLHDRPMSLREVYVPTMLTYVPALFSFERAFEAIIGALVDPPECLRCHDLSPRTEGTTAYRGGGRQAPPDFRGHDFSDTIDKALGSFAALAKGGAVIRYEIRAYAWPLLWLHYPSREVAIFTGRDGVLHAFPGAQP